MTIQEFAERHAGTNTRAIAHVARDWQAERLTRDFLGTPIAAGVLMGDLLLGDGIGDSLSTRTRAAFEELMRARADSRSEVLALIREKYDVSEESLRGLLNNIQGQVGELLFVESARGAAELATNKSQEAWDAVVRRGHMQGHWQIKVYADEHAACTKLDEVNQKLSAGAVTGADGETLDRIHFAVNDDIAEKVQDHALAIGFEGQIASLGVTQEEVRSALAGEFHNVTNPFAHFFGEVLGDVATAAAIQAAAHGFRLVAGAERRAVGEDYALALTATGIGIGAGHIVEQALDWLEGLLSIGQVGDASGSTFVVSMTTRMIARRVIVHRFRVHQRLAELASDLARLNARLGMPGPVLAPA